MARLAVFKLAVLLPFFLAVTVSARPHGHHHYPHHHHHSSSTEDVPASESTSVDVPTISSTSVELPTFTSTEIDVPTFTSTEVDIPTSTSTETEEPEPTFTSTEIEVPTSTDIEVPTATFSTETEEPEPTSTSTEIEVPTSTDVEVPTATFTTTDVPSSPVPTTPATPVPTTPSTGGTIQSLPANAKFDYQIGGPYAPASDVHVVTRDHTASAVSGLYNICYINAFQTQPGENDFADNLILKNKNGGKFEDPDWPGEFFLDTSSDASRSGILTVLSKWIDECAAKGFNAIEPDNLDTFTRSDGLLTKANNLALAKSFTDYAHSKGLAVAQKNTGAEFESDGKTQAGFDFAVAEECQTYGECDSYTDVYGSSVLEIEYTDSDNAQGNFQAACSARGGDISVILRDRNVVSKSSGQYHYEEC
ncbi:hypothetical protein EXIGLDRAFT_654578 [Exidia glandulosa HHB12029]|uniref:alpha-galactosidase n=1 Tax=Exidia glandulosa HHB12029 TaxID=1314781 RepID=A0A165DMU6_EXIGL|nr:hypothetical protein EXIGLDRAFT_654578 [Exidia glandulosa HHB12029]